jgi:hypothetical protein
MAKTWFLKEDSRLTSLPVGILNNNIAISGIPIGDRKFIGQSIHMVLPSLSGYFAKLSFLMEKGYADRQRDEAGCVVFAFSFPFGDGRGSFNLLYSPLKLITKTPHYGT